MNTPAYVYKAYINASIEAVWRAITDPDRTQLYFYGTRVESDWKVGSPIDYRHASGDLASSGEILSIEPLKRIEFTFQALWDPELVAEGPAREVWTLVPINQMVELTVEVYDIAPASKTLADFSRGLPYIVSGLKSLVETGKGLPAPY